MEFLMSLSSYFLPRRTGPKKFIIPVAVKSPSSYRCNGYILLSDYNSESSSIAAETVRNVVNVAYNSIHLVSKNCEFWNAKLQESQSRQVQCIIFERGPLLFWSAASFAASECFRHGYSNTSVANRAANTIRERVQFLSSLRLSLAAALGEVYIIGEQLNSIPPQQITEQTLSDVLQSVHSVLKGLEGSYLLPKFDLQEMDGIQSEITLTLQPWPAVSSATPATVSQLAEIVKDDTSRIQSCLKSLMEHYRRPRRIQRYWMQYTAAGVGLAAISAAFVRNSRISGSDRLERLYMQTKDASVTFVKDHVLSPLIQIRDDLFRTFRQRPQTIAEVDEVQITAEALRRMLLSFAEKVSPTSVSGRDVTDQQLMEIMMTSYEKEVASPLKSLVLGDLARAMLIQVQKLKLDIETAMLELDQILRANEINFAVLAALPALLLCIGVSGLVKAFSSYRGRGAEGRGKLAQLHRRLLLADVEKILLDSQFSKDDKESFSAQLGLLLYALQKLYSSVDKHATGLGEWPRMLVDIVNLSSSNVSLEHKLALTTRMGRVYESFTPIKS